MIIKQIYTGCLAQGAYYIESKGEVAIIDPLREVDDYIKIAENNSAKIKYVFETHFHADFVSGHVTLAEKTGAVIVYGENANPNFECIIAKDNQVFQLGAIQIKALHTPGHTLESTTFLLIDETKKKHAIFTGDTLFLGDVGRPDLAQKSNITQEELGGMLFDSLRNKIMTLPKDIIIYPGHGAGSACGKNMSKETSGILSEQLDSNYALRMDMTKEEFIKAVTNGLTEPPAYFPLNVKMNKEGYKNVTDVIKRGRQLIEVEDLERILESTGALLLDTRHQNNFAKAHIPKSIFIGIEGGFAPWVGTLIKDTKQPIVLITSEDKAEEVITRLSRVGFDNVLGILKGGVSSWLQAGKETDFVNQIEATDFKLKIKNLEQQIFDVRKETEYISAHIPLATNAPLALINNYLDSFLKLKNKSLIFHCAGGYRSMIAISILKSRGIHNVTDVIGGFKSIKEAGITTTDYICPSSL